MFKRKFLGIVAITLLVFRYSVAQQAAPIFYPTYSTYKDPPPLYTLALVLTDLGALPGDNNATVGGLNSLGQAAGTSSSSSSAIATLFSNGHTISLGAL